VVLEPLCLRATGRNGFVDLLAEFISPKVIIPVTCQYSFCLPLFQTNFRNDAYSAKHAPLHLLHRIVTAIREVLPRPFILGVKLSSSDYVGAGSVRNPQAEEEAEDRAVAHVVNVARWDMIDFIEISGGDYENPGTTSFSAPLTSHTNHASSVPFHRSPSLLCSLCP
jgi:2,4-dienoyl-CoA reductase-like NADH-dependent reductase (Old Yellow Enzyme family)